VLPLLFSLRLAVWPLLPTRRLIRKLRLGIVARLAAVRPPEVPCHTEMLRCAATHRFVPNVF
jgi:hypothetical protein